jgi:hypothetical protein
MYIVMILLLICQLMCATIPGTHIRCKHSILSFNWSVTVLERNYDKATMHHFHCKSLPRLHYLFSSKEQNTRLTFYFASKVLRPHLII